MKIPFISDALERREAARVDRIVAALPPVDKDLSPQGKKFMDVLGGVLDIPNGLSNETTISKKLLKANKEWVFRNNDVIAMEISKMEFELYSIGLKDGEITYTEIQSHPLLDLLDRPNPETTSSDALYIIQSHKKLAGDAFWVKLRNGRKVTALRSLPPDKVTLDLQSPTEKDPTVIKGYKYDDVIDGEKVHIYYQPEDVIHIKKPNPNNYFRGFGSVEAMAETIDVDNLTNLTTKNFFKKGAITNFILSTEQKVNSDQLKRIQAEMKQMYSGAQNAYKTMILGGGLTPQKLTFSNKDMEFLAQLAWYRDKIMTGFGNTLASLGMLDDVNRATHESSMIEWKRNTVKPDMDSILDALNEFLVPEFGNNLILGYTDPIPEDRTDDIAEAEQLYAGGIIMLNEARELTGYDTVDGGDTFYSAPSPFGALPSTDATPADNADDPNVEDEIDNIEDEEGEGEKAVKRIYRTKNWRFKKRSPTQVPASLAHLNVKALLRRRGMFLKQQHNKELKEAFKPVVKSILTKAKKDGTPMTIEKAVKIATKSQNEDGTYTPPPNKFLNSDQIMDYYHKQLHTIESIEEAFDKQITKFLGYVRNKVVDHLESEVEAAKSNKQYRKILDNFSTKDWLDDNEDDFLAQAQLDFTPLLDNLGVISGQDATKLIGGANPYILSSAMKARIASNVTKFTKSMLDTDRQHIVNTITSGIENGDSLTKIRDALTNDEALSYTRNQSMRITRTEVSRTSMQSASDAWEQSGVVEGKQWITAGADDECADYEGQVESLDGNFYGDTDEFADGDPPLHPNCRCSLVPVVMDNAQQDNPGFFGLTPLNEGGFIGGDDEDAVEAGFSAYHGKGGQPMSQSPMLGDAYYVSRSKNIAAEFGDVSEVNIALQDNQVLQITSDKQLDDLITKAIATYPNLDPNKAIPKFIQTNLGFQAAEVSESVDPYGGIAIYNKKLITQL